MQHRPVSQPDLVRELGTLDACELFTEARNRQPAFQDHTTIWSVLACLEDRDRDDYYEEAEPLVRAVVAEYQRQSHRLWSAALLIAFWLALRRIEREHAGDRDVDHLQGVVADAFLWTARNLDLDDRTDRTAMWLRNGTRDRVRTWARKERGHRRRHVQRAADEGDADEPSDPDEPGRGERTDSALDARRGVERVVAAYGEALVLALITEETGVECLRDQVRRLHAHLDEVEMEREYQRAKKAHQRARAAIRAMFDDGDVPSAAVAAPSSSMRSMKEPK
jgi:hypothetical protein